MVTIINFLWNAFKVLGLLCIDGIMLVFILNLLFGIVDIMLAFILSLLLGIADRIV